MQVDGFLGGSANGYPDQIRDEMKSLFDRGWFEEEPESEAQFKVGPYRITNQDCTGSWCLKNVSLGPVFTKGQERGKQRMVEHPPNPIGPRKVARWLVPCFGVGTPCLVLFKGAPKEKPTHLHRKASTFLGFQRGNRTFRSLWLALAMCWR